MKGPSEQSTKRPVSKVREIPGLKPKSQSLYQDPRFDTALGKGNLASARKNYQFLDAYRQSEIDEMSRQIKATKNDEDRELLSKAIQSQRSRLETLKRRDEEEDILRGVKKNLSRSKKRELILKERFNRMSSREVARTVERRRRKVAQKQKKLLPERRTD